LKKTKPHKVIVIGLPKTGTSTIAVMLRMLGYEVSGPDINIDIGEEVQLTEYFNQATAFQDYPWCFEWKRIRGHCNLKFIILYRNKESWWKSFYESYGGLGMKYLSYPYMNILKSQENKSKFIEFYDSYYDEAKKFQKENPKNCFYTEISSISWADLCCFLEEEIPRNFLGQVCAIPHVNKKNYTLKRSIYYRSIKMIKNTCIQLFGIERYKKVVVFLHKNKI